MKNIYFTITTFMFLLWDLISKFLIERLVEGKTVILWWFLYFEKVYNSGIAFSFPVPPLLLKVLTWILIFWIILYYFHTRKKDNFSFYDLSFSLIIGGALGNAHGRLWDGYVLDFIWVPFFSVFNIADICISTGVILLLYVERKSKKQLTS